MIYTVTFNPAVDYVVRAENIETGGINRLQSEEIYFGGKGINVSLVLSELGMRSKALGFIAGFTGEAIEKGLRENGVETDFVHLKSGFSRINVKIKSDVETELNGCGPVIDDESLAGLFSKLKHLENGDMLVLAGSIPNTLPSDIYEKILGFLADRNIRTVIDATKDLLVKSLKYRPFLIKPNNYELGEIFGVKPETDDDIIHYASELKKMGAENVLVSMAGDGALLLDENGMVHKCSACKGTVRNSVGAGDSMVAGFIAGSVNGDYGYALKLGTACGGATAFSDGLARKDDIFRLMGQNF